MSGAYTPGDVPQTPADLRALAAALRRSGAADADEIAANLETLADSRDPEAIRRAAAGRICDLAGDFRSLVVATLRVVVRLEAMGETAEAAKYREIANRYDEGAGALERAICEAD